MIADQVISGTVTRSAVVMNNARSCRKERVACCVCGSDEASPIASGGDFEYETTGDEFSMVRCGDCGFVYLNPRPTLDELSTIYPKAYYAYDFGSRVHSLARIAKDRLDRRKVAQWLSLVDAPRPRFLDVGCGDGRYLRMLHTMGLPRDELYGVELSEDVVSQLNEEGFQARCGRFEEVDNLPAGGFDLIIMLQVIEHVANPATCIKRLAELLAPGGVLVLETPSTGSLDHRLFEGSYWGGYHFPRHWNLFTEQTLGRLLRAGQLTPIQTRYLPSPSFWIHSLHHVTKYGLRMPRVANLFDTLRNVPLIAAFTAFDMFRATWGRQTSNMQMAARRV